MDGLGQMNAGITNEKWKRIFTYTVVFLISYFILITSVAPTIYDLKVGDIANEDIKAPREILDEEAKEKREKEVAESAPKQYSTKNEVKLEANKIITEFFHKLINTKSDTISEDEKVLQLRKLESFNLTDTEYKTLLSVTNEKVIEMQWILMGVMEKVYENNIIEVTEEEVKNATTLTQAKDLAVSLIGETNLDEKLKSILSDMAKVQIKPNYFYDKEKTLALINEILQDSPVDMIKKNQIIVKEGEQITQRDINILNDLGLLGGVKEKSYFVVYMTLGVFIFLILLLQYMYLKKERIKILGDNKLVMLIALLNILNLVFARTIIFTSPFLIPLACTTILMTILLDYKLAVIINILNMLLVAVIVGFDPQIIILSIISIIIGATSIKKINGRNDVLYTTVFLVIGAAIATFGAGIMLSNNSKIIVYNVMLSVLGALFTGILAIGILPFLEMTFKIVTNMKLLELSNPNNPLLKRVLMETPGTYHHSLMVANLAEIAAEEVDANPIVARIGAYYHDIGKLKRPIFFGENQMGHENPHDNIDPSLSTHIILSHAKDGLELAKEYKLPDVIQDIIIQHHGTTLVKYFYYTVKNATENPEDVKEEDFRYEGPIPSSKEAAIIMLADSVEAAVRSINEPSRDKIEEMVNNIVKDKLYSNQLDNSDLTLRDIDAIKKCFLRMLNGLYHQRVEYPKENGKE